MQFPEKELGIICKLKWQIILPFKNIPF
uniref:Uncharacterized protein n=1 Tax=Rhizophora mucronata TaxID=61149 RepID=A0A2P2QZ55_RHIMU